MPHWKSLSRNSQRRTQQEYDLQRELRADLELEAEEQQERGASAEEARYRAVRSLGNAALVSEDVRRTWRGARFEQFTQDFRYGLRGLRRNKGFTLIAAFSLALRTHAAKSFSQRAASRRSTPSAAFPHAFTSIRHARVDLLPYRW